MIDTGANMVFLCFFVLFHHTEVKVHIMSVCESTNGNFVSTEFWSLTIHITVVWSLEQKLEFSRFFFFLRIFSAKNTENSLIHIERITAPEMSLMTPVEIVENCFFNLKFKRKNIKICRMGDAQRIYLMNSNNKSIIRSNNSTRSEFVINLFVFRSFFKISLTLFIMFDLFRFLSSLLLVGKKLKKFQFKILIKYTIATSKEFLRSDFLR